MRRAPIALGRRAWGGSLGLIAGLAAGPACAGTEASADALGGELRSRYEARGANQAGPIGVANTFVPGIAPQALRSVVLDAELRGTWRAPAIGAARAALGGAALVATERRGLGDSRETHTQARLNEGFAAGDFGNWQMSAGKRVVAWDIGQAFRPNDVVQQEARRTLLALPQEGRPLLELEHYDAHTAGALVWVNPQHANVATEAQRGAAESALAGRGYVRDGSADWHIFGRCGRHTRASVGAALAWVATDEVELHASARLMQHHEGWRIEPQAASVPVGANPWRQATLGRSAQGLLGGSWTGADQISVLIEWWYDGTALADRDWLAWQLRNQALVAFAGQAGLPQNLVVAAAGNLAWQATPMSAGNLRRDNAFVRLAWQPPRWVVSLDALITPRDRGHVVTAAAQWQGERLRLNAAWRIYSGPTDALFAQLPQRDTGMLSVTWPF